MAYAVIRLKSISYSGKDIGNDLQFELTVNGTTTTLSKALSHLDTWWLDQVIYAGGVAGGRSGTRIQIQVTEEDLVINDVGSVRTRFEIDADSDLVQKHTARVDVTENPRATATFKFHFEAVTGENRYVSDVDPNGWLNVKLDNGTILPLPHMLKVELEQTLNGREFFTIGEGKLQGQRASVSLPAGNGSYFLATTSHTGPIQLTFDKTAGKLTVPGLGDIDAMTDPSNPVPNGTYDLEIPYEPHPGGAGYESQSKYAKTWFRIGHTGDRFLHPGRVSLGCTTVTDVGHWTAIYRSLIKARKDDRSVGTLVVR